MVLLLAFHVILDPGHGGSDRGAKQHGQEEAILSLQIAEKLATKLKKDPNFRVTLTRQSDQLTPLQNRSQMAKDKNGDLFLSLHLNSSLDERIQGAEFYIQNQMSTEEESLYLASRENGSVGNIIEDLKKSNDTFESAEFVRELKKNWKSGATSKSPQLKQAPFFVLSEIPMPSALLELGYLSHKEEAQWFSVESHQEQVADNIYRALKRYKAKVDKTTSR